MPDIGELVVGAWLTQVQGFDFVVYNHHPGSDLPAEFAPKGLAGVSARLGELDVIGINTRTNSAYLAECTTHLDGLLIGSGTEDGVRKLASKLALAGAYGRVLASRTALTPELSVWSPRVPKAVEARWPEVVELAGHEASLIANDEYASRVRQIASQARSHTTVTGNDFYRTLQLLTHLSQSPFVDLPKGAQKHIAEGAAEVAVAAPILPWSEVVKVHRTQAGIRAPRGGSEASIICNTGLDGPYPDRFLGPDVLHYVGRGFEGDQELDRDNESLRQAVERGVTIRVFEQLGKNRYIDRGDWEGVAEPLWHLEAGSNRRLIIFTLRRISGG
jgi:hypothetical protein